MCLLIESGFRAEHLKKKKMYIQVIDDEPIGDDTGTWHLF